MGLFNKLLVTVIPFVPKPIIGIFSRKYIAGDTLQHAVNLVKKLNSEGMCATIDVLGESKSKKEEVRKVVEEYKLVLKAISENNLDSNISVKPTHLGLKIDKDYCYENIKELVELAKSYNNFVRIDMEDSTCTTDTIDIYLKLRQNYDNVGVVIQAYMRRTIDDVNKLINVKANLRLCKGIYVEPRMIAYKDKAIINYNYGYVLEKLLKNGCYVGIATHDEKLVWEGMRIVDELKLNKNQYEFQMLLGVDAELRKIIVNAGHRLRIYVPFGKDWHAYSIRRLKENPNIAGDILKNIFKPA